MLSTASQLNHINNTPCLETAENAIAFLTVPAEGEDTDIQDNGKSKQEMINATNAVKTAAIGGRATICRLILDAINKGTIEPIQKFHLQRKEKNKTKRIKAAFNLPRLNKAAQCVATIIANEPPAQMPVLCRPVQEMTAKLTSEMERSLQPLKDQLKAIQGGKKSPKKIKGDGTKKTPTGILKNKDTPAATKRKSAQSIIAPDLGVNNSATVRTKGKKKLKRKKVSFNGKKAAKPTKSCR
jgi:hypothetical protein